MESFEGNKADIKSKAMAIYRLLLESIHYGRTTQQKINEAVMVACGYIDKHTLNALNTTLHDLNVFIDNEDGCLFHKSGFTDSFHDQTTQYDAKEALDYFLYLLFGYDTILIDLPILDNFLKRKKIFKPTSRIINRLKNLQTAPPILIPITLLFSALEENSLSKLNRGAIEALAVLLENLGYGMVPDIRHYNIKPNACDRVFVFPNSNGDLFFPSDEFSTLAIVLSLGITVLFDADQDKFLSGGVKELNKLIVDNGAIEAEEKKHLMVFLNWLLSHEKIDYSYRKPLSKVSFYERVSIGQSLIYVTLADGLIDAEKIKRLEKVYETLGLNPKKVLNDININIRSPANVPVMVALRDAETTFQIQYPPNTESRSNSFTLNQELIKKREKETRQVKTLLENVFVDVDHEDKVPTSPIPVKRPSENLLEILDQTHRTLFRELVSQEVWERSDFLAKCRKLGLMVDGAMEVLNEWAFEKVDAALIEDGDPIYINVDVAMEMMNVK